MSTPLQSNKNNWIKEKSFVTCVTKNVTSITNISVNVVNVFLYAKNAQNKKVMKLIILTLWQQTKNLPINHSC